MTPAFLLTTTHHLLAFDGQCRFFRVHSGKGLYYGLAHSDQRIYVSCRNQTEAGSYDASGTAAENGSILVFDAASLLPIDELRPEEFPLRDVHGIAHFDGKLWITSSFDNLVAVFDIAARRWTKWYPSIDVTARDHDVNHFNTIVAQGERICLLAHNQGPSHLLFYDRSSLELTSVLPLGCQAHDIFPAGGGIGTCSSADGLLVAGTGWTIRTGAFPRGIASGSDGFLVGLSQTAHRSIRHEMSGFIRRFTPDWHFAADYVLPGVGMVLAILPLQLDLTVLAALEPFEAQSFRGEYNPLEPGNVYYPGRGGNAPWAPKWHVAEGIHRWTAAPESYMTVVLNPGETTLAICCCSSFPGPYSAEVLLEGQSLGRISWAEPGHAYQEFILPSGMQGSCELCFRVPHLWQPSVSLGTDDQRMLGIGIQELRIL